METTTLAALLDWRSIGPGRQRMACPRCAMAIELRLLDDLLEVACPGCGAGPFFERARDYEAAHGSEAVKALLAGLGILSEDELRQAEEAAGPVAPGAPDQRDLVGAARALGFFHKSLFLAHQEGSDRGVAARPLRELISADQLREAVDIERREGRPTGEVLSDLVLAGEKERLRQDLGAPEPIDLDGADVADEVRALVPANVAASLLAIPVRLEGDALRVALRDPLDFQAIDTLKFHTGREILTAAAPEEALFRALERLYPEDAALDAAYDDDFDDDLALLSGEPEALPEGEADEPAEEDLDRVPDMPDDAPGERTLDALLAQVVEQRASLLAIEPLDIYYRARVRVGGLLRDAARLPRKVGEAVIERAMVRAGLDASRADDAQTGTIEVGLGGARASLEVAYAPQPEGAALAFRPREPGFRLLTLEGLALVPGDAQLVRAALHGPPGLVLIGAPPGEGRTTLLYACLREADRQGEQVLSLERRAPQRIEGAVQLTAARYDDLGEALARMRPDRVLIDDLPRGLARGADADEVRVALDLALSGARVIVATAAPSAPLALARLAATGVDARLLASTLTAFVSARLVKRVCPRCRVDFDADDALAHELGLGDDARTMAAGLGCWECGGRGYRGRSALIEVIPVESDAIREAAARLDREGLAVAARAEGHRLIADKALFALRAGLTSVTEVEAILAPR